MRLIQLTFVSWIPLSFVSLQTALPASGNTDEAIELPTQGCHLCCDRASAAPTPQAARCASVTSSGTMQMVQQRHPSSPISRPLQPPPAFNDALPHWIKPLR